MLYRHVRIDVCVQGCPRAVSPVLRLGHAAEVTGPVISPVAVQVIDLVGEGVTAMLESPADAVNGMGVALHPGT